MKLYIDCTNGVSSDMILNALRDLGASGKVPEVPDPGHRSFTAIRRTIEALPVNDTVRAGAISIYKVIAEAEAEVHGETLETVHFHEVGRVEAMRNIVGIAAALDELAAEDGSGIEKILVSPVHDGHGSIECSHGRIPVPVPAVQAMKKHCDYDFETDDIETEMVTPSGLAVLIGIGAEKAGKTVPGRMIRSGTGRGTRDTGRDGMTVSIFK